jgi:hypothetical protein
MASLGSSVRSVLLRTGLTTPIRRALALGGAVGLGLYVAKPESMFDTTGIRPWSILDTTARATQFPVYLAMLAAAGVGFYLL